jgi:gliding motility-associated-like protein
VAGQENGAANVTGVDGLVIGVDAAALTNYTYAWYDGSTADPLNIKGGETNPTLGSTTPGAGIQGGLPSSVFTVLVTGKTNGCQSNRAITIPDAKANPVISVTLMANNTICDPLLGTNGSLTSATTYKGVLQSPLPINYIVTWSTTATGETLSGLAAGNYSAHVTDNITGCISSDDVGTIVDQFDLPVITPVVLNKQTSCDLLNPNGQLQAVATNGPLGSTLEFTWFDGIGTGGSVIASATTQASGANLQTPGTLVSNNYTFQAKNEVTGCLSTSTILLPLELTYPTFTGFVTDVTVCVPTNGQVDITLGTLSDPAQFTIYYLNEINFAQTGDPAIVKASATAMFSNDPTKLVYTGTVPAHKLIPGNYTVLIRDEVTKCESNAETFTVDDNTVKTVTASIAASATFCNSNDGGRLDLTVLPAAAYTYQWFEGVATNTGFDFMNNANTPTFGAGVMQTSKDLTGETNGDFSGVSNGIYSVVVTDPVGCGKVFSETVPFVGAPDITLDLTNSSKCDPLISDASIEVTVSPNAATIPGSLYSIRLFTTHSSTTGTYVNGEDDGCNDGIDNDGDGDVDTADSDCGLNNANTIFTNESALLTGSPSVLLGDYLVRVYDNLAGCEIEKVVTLDIDPKLPIVSIDAITPSTACVGGVGDGTVKLTVTKDPLDTTTPNYQIGLVTPVHIGGAIPQALITGVSTFVTGTFSAQAYTLKIEDPLSGCSVDQFVNVPSQPGIPTAFTVTPTNDDFCAPSTNGSALVTTLTTTAPSAFTDFNFEWYKDNALTTLVTPIVAGNGSNTGGELLTSTEVIAFNAANWPINATPGLGNGNKTFYVRAQKQNGPGDKCYSPIAQININDTHSAPQLTLLPFSNTSCSATNEGRIEVTTTTLSTDPLIQNSAYTYSWTPVTAGTPDAGENGAVTYTIGSLAANTYSITALNEQSRCLTTNSTDVLDTKFDISITDKLIADQDICPIGGQVDVTEIQINRNITSQTTLTLSGVTLSSDFTYEWFKAPAGNPNIFNNAAPLQDSGPSTINGISLIAGSAGQQYPTMGEGTYYVIATRTNSLTLPGKMCPSQPLRVDVKDKRVFPTVSFATVATTACDVNHDGRITVTASTASGPGSASNYNFVWTNDPDGLGGPLFSASNSASNNTASPFSTVAGDLVGLGQYDIRVTNFITQCSTDASVNVLKSTVPMNIVSLTPTHLDVCSLPVNGAGTISSVSPGVTGDFVYTWDDDALMGSPFVTNNAALTQGTLNAGTYYVVGRRNAVVSPATPGVSGSGCTTSPASFTVLDKRVFPTVSFATVATTACDVNHDGRITVTASTASGPGSGSNYNFVWTNDPDGLGLLDFSASNSPSNNTASPFTTSATDKVGEGQYDIRVTNFTTQCVTDAVVFVSKNVPVVEILSVSKLDQRDCSPFFDGNITVNATDVSLPGTYDFTWEKAGVPVMPTPTPSNIYDQIDFGIYTVQGTKNGGVGSGCITSKYPVEILDLTQKPAIDIASIANIGCTVATGEIEASIREGFTPGITVGYSFLWYRGVDDTSGASIGGTPSLAGFVHDDYAVYVTDDASPNRGCTNNATLPILFEATTFAIDNAITAQTLCAPTLDGSITVTEITENISSRSPQSYDMSVAGDRTRFDFQWFDNTATPVPPTSPLPVNGAHILNGVVAGDYYIKVINSFGCPSDLSLVTIDDQTTHPAVVLSTFRNPAICILPERAGALEVMADGGTNLGNYSFDWYIGNTALAPAPPFFSGEQLSGIGSADPDTYTIRVTNNTTNCFTDETYQVETEVMTIQTLASGVPLTSCSVANGSLFATTVQGNGNLYTYDWFIGTVVDASPDYTGNQVLNAPLGLYTAIAKISDPALSSCIILPDTASVLKRQIHPIVNLTPVAPVTYCDPAKQNGAARADVSGSVIGFTFDWFEDAVSNATPYYTGSHANGLRAKLYVVRATDDISGCDSTGSITIEFDPILIPSPTIEVLSNYTDCQVPNGALTASVNGTTQDHEFKWYDGGVVTNQPDATSEIYSDLDDQVYAVVATDRESGCDSQPVTETIEKIFVLPEFEIKTRPENCEQVNGYAEVITLNNSDIYIVEWNINGTIFTGATLSDLLAGAYEVTAISSLNCTQTATFEIKSELNIFNGISNNNDGQNDFFEIACIQNYPNNTVRIFNRSGTLVFENKGYDNQEVFFDGTSNKGINILGKDLPDGTYFYIIDKGDGTKPQTGYLELLR